MLYSCVTITDKLTGQNIGCKQALQLEESRENHATAARERRREYEKGVCKDLK